MTINVVAGFDSVEKLRIMMAKKMGLNSDEILKKIEINEALPTIISGMRISISVALIINFIIEYSFPSAGGIGSYILDRNGNVNHYDELSAAMVYLGFLGYILNFIFLRINKKYCSWKE